MKKQAKKNGPLRPCAQNTVLVSRTTLGYSLRSYVRHT